MPERGHALIIDSGAGSFPTSKEMQIVA